MGNGDFVVVEHARDNRGAHPFALGLALCGLVYDFVGTIYGITEHDGLTHHAAVVVDTVSFLAWRDGGCLSCEGPAHQSACCPEGDTDSAGIRAALALF